MSTRSILLHVLVVLATAVGGTNSGYTSSVSSMSLVTSMQRGGRAGQLRDPSPNDPDIGDLAVLDDGSVVLDMGAKRGARSVLDRYEPPQRRWTTVGYSFSTSADVLRLRALPGNRLAETSDTAHRLRVWEFPRRESRTYPLPADHSLWEIADAGPSGLMLFWHQGDASNLVRLLDLRSRTMGEPVVLGGTWLAHNYVIRAADGSWYRAGGRDVRVNSAILIRAIPTPVGCDPNSLSLYWVGPRHYLAAELLDEQTINLLWVSRTGKLLRRVRTRDLIPKGHRIPINSSSGALLTADKSGTLFAIAASGERAFLLRLPPQHFP